MVFELLGIAAVPTATGVAGGLSTQDKSESPHSEELRMEKFNLTCYCTPNTRSARRLNNGRVVLRDGKLYIVPRNEKIKGHLFEGFYIAYPDTERPQPPPMGLISSISSEPILLNWIYVDRNTRGLRYGNRTQSREHIVGSWDWVSSDEDDPGGLTLNEEEAAVAVRTTEDSWEVKWADTDGTSCTVGTEIVELSLERKLVSKTGKKRPEPGKMPCAQENAMLTRDNISRINNPDGAKQRDARPTAGLGRKRRHRRRKSKKQSEDLTENKGSCLHDSKLPP